MKRVDLCKFTEILGPAKDDADRRSGLDGETVKTWQRVVVQVPDADGVCV
jgi:hypothetical protein